MIDERALAVKVTCSVIHNDPVAEPPPAVSRTTQQASFEPLTYAHGPSRLLVRREENKDVAKQAKTNAMRILEREQTPYTVHTFAAVKLSAVEVAERVGKPAGQVFKTLVVLSVGPRPRTYLAVIPGDRELDLKKMAKVVGQKRLQMAAQKQAEKLTGLQVGGISPLALLSKGFGVLVDRSATEHERILVSAGQRGINLELSPHELIRIVKGSSADLTRPTSG